MKKPFYVYDHVRFVDTADEHLEGCTGTVEGYHQEEYLIVRFDSPPQGVFPAIVISCYCLERLDQLTE